MGIQLQFPKMIQYKIDDGYDALKSTRDLKSYWDFEKIRASIKGISHALTIKAAGMERRTDIWISNRTENKPISLRTLHNCPFSPPFCQ